MPKATKPDSTPAPILQPPPNRRGILAGIVAALAVPAVAGARILPSVGNNPDADLIALCARLDEMEHAYCATGFNFDDDTPEGQAADAERDVIQARQDEVVELISDTPARTIEGVQAIARSLALWVPDSMANGPRDNGEVLQNVILQNLLKLSGRDA